MSKWTPNYHVACAIQRKILNKMDESKTTAANLATLANAWNTLEERKRILRMKGLPKSVEVKPKKSGPVHVAPTE